MERVRLTVEDSIQKAVDSASNDGLEIILSPGVYKEKVVITKRNIRLIGEEVAVIDFDDHHGTCRGGRVYGTGDSATFTVAAPCFYAENVVFSNSFDYPRWHEYNSKHSDDRIDTQAVAFRTVIGADETKLNNCSFESWQDTVYADSGSHLFLNCNIKGNVDFIFGAGEAYFYNCNIISIGEGFVAAPSTLTSSDIGFVFDSCKISAEDSVGEVFLARPWHPSGSINRSPMALFSSCAIGSHIASSLWTVMGSRTPEGIERVWTPEESRFSVDGIDNTTVSKEKVEKCISTLRKKLL